MLKSTREFYFKLYGINYVQTHVLEDGTECGYYQATDDPTKTVNYRFTKLELNKANKEAQENLECN